MSKTTVGLVVAWIALVGASAVLSLQSSIALGVAVGSVTTAVMLGVAVKVSINELAAGFADSVDERNDIIVDHEEDGFE